MSNTSRNKLNTYRKVCWTPRRDLASQCPCVRFAFLPVFSLFPDISCQLFPRDSCPVEQQSLSTVDDAFFVTFTAGSLANLQSSHALTCDSVQYNTSG